jgi:peptide-methionine (S)-S-oxide reductase
MNRITALSAILLILLLIDGPRVTTGKVNAMEKATFGAGCFWGIEETFRNLEGVVETRVGYMGGSTDNPTYKDVCSKTTGHAEVVEVIYDPDILSYGDLLKAFWEMHDPTQINRQGPDTGDQYRSAIFYHTDMQKLAAQGSKSDMDRSGRFNKPIATEITRAGTFWDAEEYHQKYLMKRGAKSCGVK